MNKFIYPILLLLIFIRCQPQPEQKPEAAIGTMATLQAARKIMQGSSCTLVTVDQHAKPYARVMDPLFPDENFVVWLATNPLSRKVEHLYTNPNVVLHYVDASHNGYVSLYGQAELVRDTTQFDLHWKPEWDRFYRNRNACVLIKVIPSRLEIIDYNRMLSGDPVTWQPNVIVF
ncbi:MAG: pyridoxamine 5'-phosphate oxidase family protein [Cyclobacteriaceae bacterium]|nr:pyridoxamine 5'-phosphate oxidase family protein [Cyclobacteriaceae bacterium]